MNQYLPTHIYLQIILHMLFISIFVYKADAYSQDQGPKSGVLRKCWDYPVRNPAKDSLASDNAKIFIASEDGSIHAVDPVSARGIWKTELGGEAISNLLATETAVFVITTPVDLNGGETGTAILRSLSKETGITNWVVRLPLSTQFYLGSTLNTIVAVSQEGSLTAIDSKDGRTVWNSRVYGDITAKPVFSDQGVVFGSDQKRVFVIANDDGRQLFEFITAFSPTAVANGSGGVVAIGDARGNLQFLDVKSGRKIWKFKSGASISQILVTKNGLLVTSLDNFIYLISNHNGDIIWKRRTSGRVEGGAFADQDLVFGLASGDNSGVLLDARNGKILDLMSENGKIYPSQTPLFRGSQIFLATTEGIEAYGITPCTAK